MIEDIREVEPVGCYGLVLVFLLWSVPGAFALGILVGRAW